MSDTQRRLIRTSVTLGRDAERAGDVLATSIRGDLEAARREIAGRLVDLDPSWQRGQLETLLGEVERQLRGWETATILGLNGQQTQIAGRAMTLVTAALRDAGVSGGAHPALAAKLLQRAHEHSAVNIRDVATEVIRKVDTTLRRAAVGGVDPVQAMKDLGKVVGKGAFATANDRAEAIVRTEMTSIAQGAADDTIRDFATTIDGLQKQWIAVIDDRTRPSHIEADQQIVDVDDTFSVGDDELDYPGDPDGSPEETINCRCVSSPYHEDW